MAVKLPAGDYYIGSLTQLLTTHQFSELPEDEDQPPGCAQVAEIDDHLMVFCNTCSDLPVWVGSDGRTYDITGHGGVADGLIAVVPSTICANPNDHLHHFSGEVTFVGDESDVGHVNIFCLNDGFSLEFCTEEDSYASDN